MNAHHIIKPEDNKNHCIYCKSSLEDSRWSSEFVGFIHYKKIVSPTCKSKNIVRVDFDGSGHDSWDGKHPLKNRGLRIKSKKSSVNSYSKDNIEKRLR